MYNNEPLSVLDQANRYLDFYQDNQVNLKCLREILKLKSIDNIKIEDEYAQIGEIRIEKAKVNDLINANIEIAALGKKLTAIEEDIEAVNGYRIELEEGNEENTVKIYEILKKNGIKISEPKETPTATKENDEKKKEKKQRIFQKEITQLNKKKSAVKRKIEETEHQRFVDECLKPRGFKNGINEVYALINPLDESDIVEYSNPDTITYHVSLLTPAMAYTDFRYFFDEFEDGNKPWWHEYYRPYYYELWVDVDNNGDNRAEWDKLCRFSLENGFIKAKIYPDNDKENTNENEAEQAKDEESFCGTLRFGGSETSEEVVHLVPAALVDQIAIDDKDQARYNAIKTKIKKKEIIDDDDQVFFDRLSTKKGLLKSIIDRTIANNKKEFEKNNSDLKDINTYLDARFKWFNNTNKQFDIETEILNVGAANCMHFNVGSSLSFMFDVGIPYKTYKDSNTKTSVDNTDYLSKRKGHIRGSIGSISKYNPDFIILSHFHYDHVLGIAHLSDRAINNSVWIIPKLDDNVKDLTCLRLAMFKAKQKKLIVIEDKYNECIYDSSFFKMFRGKGKGDLNDSSLMLLINNNSIALFAADCRYGSWPDANKGFSSNVLKSIDYLIVPHHGSKYQGDYSVLDVFKDSCQAYICCGKGSYDHPRSEHLHELNTRFSSDNIYLTGGTLASTKDNKYEYEYKDAKGNKSTEYVKIKKGTIEFTL